MGKIAFIFSGQGDQFPGMGKELYDRYPEARTIFDLCDRIRPGNTEQCFSGTMEELSETRNTQPCLFTMELAAANVLTAKGVKPDSAAGFSLGEIAAAAVCGVIERETGFRLVMRRGELMQSTSEKADTSMAAVVRLNSEQVEALCSRYPKVYPVNYNCPGQITVSGLSAQMPDFCADVKKAGGRAIPLKVRGAFHSPFMKEAAEKFVLDLEKAEPVNPVIPLYSNLTAEPYRGNLVRLLSEQICNPVRWEKIIRSMIAAETDTFIEIGPGKTLTNMVRKISPNVMAMNVAEYLAQVEEKQRS